MDNKNLTFNDIPQALEEILERLNRIESILSDLNTNKEDDDRWMNPEELINYLPSHPSKGTIYKWTSTREIPYYRQGKNILFRKSDIDKWLNGERIKTSDEIKEEAHRDYQRRFGHRN